METVFQSAFVACHPRGKAVGLGLNGGEAAKFRYLLPQTENGAEEDDGGFEI